jgi:hypothetical protein
LTFAYPAIEILWSMVLFSNFSLCVILHEQLRELGQKRSKSDDYQDGEETNEDRAQKLIDQLLMPIGMSIVQNWKFDSRREAAFVLDHIAGSGPEATKVVTDIARELKRVSVSNHVSILHIISFIYPMISGELIILICKISRPNRSASLKLK